MTATKQGKVPVSFVLSRDIKELAGRAAQAEGVPIGHFVEVALRDKIAAEYGTDDPLRGMAERAAQVIMAPLNA